MGLNAVVQHGVPGASGFDTDTVVTANVAELFAKQGYKFCVRYLSLAAAQLPGDLSQKEAIDILGAGLALMAVQHVRRPGWYPSQSTGASDGSHAAYNARQVGLPTGTNVWCDLEGVNASVNPQDTIAYCNAWFTAVQNAGYIPGLYVGANTGLTGHQLYDLAFAHYWKSESRVPELPARGYQMVQSIVNGLVNGISIDGNVTATDALGGQVLWACS